MNQSAALLEAIKEYDAQKWKIIGQKVGKPAKVSSISPPALHSQDDIADGLQACEQYARDHFSGRI